MTDTFLDKMYTARSAEDTRAIYDQWASSYDAEIAENGYATPGRIAKALHALLPEPQAPILDFGCGTGLSGLALKLAGFEIVDGMDISADMLAQAEAKGIYRTLTRADPDAQPDIPGGYRAITATGVIGTGAAPVSVLDALIDALPKGGLLAFSFNDHTLQDRIYEGRLNEYLDTGTARLLFREHGDHLPGIGLKANVYVIEKN